MSLYSTIEEVFEKAGLNNLQGDNMYTLKDLCFYMGTNELRVGEPMPVLKFVVLDTVKQKEIPIEMALSYEFPVKWSGSDRGVEVVDIEISEELRSEFLRAAVHFPKERTLCMKADEPTDNPVILSEWKHGKFIVAHTEEDYAIVKVWSLLRSLWSTIRYSNLAPNNVADEDDEDDE